MAIPTKTAKGAAAIAASAPRNVDRLAGAIKIEDSNTSVHLQRLLLMMRFGLPAATAAVVASR